MAAWQGAGVTENWAHVSTDLQSSSAPPGLNDAEFACWNDFLESSALLCDTLNRTLIENHKLTLFDIRLLDLLAKADGGSARMGDVADALMLQPSRVTEQILRLEAKGLVSRSASKRDRRGVIASVTGEGRARLKPALVTYARTVRAYYLGQLNRQQMIALGECSRRISAGLKSEPAARIGRF